MHICVVGDTGGRHVRSRAKALIAQGHQVSSVTPRASGEPELDERVPHGKLNSPSYLINLHRLVCGCPGDLVHVHFASSTGAWLYVISGDRRPLVVTAMGGDVLFDEQGSTSNMARWLTLQVLKRADLITAKSSYVRDAIIELGLPPEKVITMVWGIDLASFGKGNPEAARQDLGIGIDRRVILSPRILRPLYNHHLIVEAMPAILERVPNACLVICEYEAEASYKARITALSRELDITDAIVFAGVISHVRMPDYYALAEVTVGIPASDAFPQTVFEAMACETPNVVSRLDRYEEYLRDGENALFANITAESVASCCLQILEDEDKAERLRVAGAETVVTHGNLSNDIDRIENYYRNLLKTTPRAPSSPAIRLGCFLILAGLGLKTALRNLVPYNRENG